MPGVPPMVPLMPDIDFISAICLVVLIDVPPVCQVTSANEDKRLRKQKEVTPYKKKLI